MAPSLAETQWQEQSQCPKVSTSETVETSKNTHIYVRLRLDFLAQPALPVSFPSSTTCAGLLPFSFVTFAYFRFLFVTGVIRCSC